MTRHTYRGATDAEAKAVAADAIALADLAGLVVAEIVFGTRAVHVSYRKV